MTEENNQQEKLKKQQETAELASKEKSLAPEEKNRLRNAMQTIFSTQAMWFIENELANTGEAIKNKEYFYAGARSFITLLTAATAAPLGITKQAAKLPAIGAYSAYDFAYSTIKDPLETIIKQAVDFIELVGGKDKNILAALLTTSLDLLGMPKELVEFAVNYSNGKATPDALKNKATDSVTAEHNKIFDELNKQQEEILRNQGEETQLLEKDQER